MLKKKKKIVQVTLSLSPMMKSFTRVLQLFRIFGQNQKVSKQISRVNKIYVSKAPLKVRKCIGESYRSSLKPAYLSVCYIQFEYFFLKKSYFVINSRGPKTFCKRPGSKYFRLCGPAGLCLSHSSLPLQWGKRPETTCKQTDTGFSDEACLQKHVRAWFYPGAVVCRSLICSNSETSGKNKTED